MKSSFNQLFLSLNAKGQSVGNKFLLLTSMVGIAVLSSCASDPMPIICPVPEVLPSPTPSEEAEDIEPDNIDLGRATDDGNASVEVGRKDPELIRTAKPVPGRPGFVFNPYTQNMVDVDGIPSGTKVKDPHDKNEAHVFKVP